MVSPSSTTSSSSSTTTLFLSSPGVNDNALQLCSFHHQESNNYTHTFHNLEVSGKRKQCIWARSNQKGSSIHLFGSVVLDPILFLPSTVSDKFLTSETNSGISSSSSNVVEIQEDKEGEDGEKSDEKRVSNKKMRKIEAKKKQKELQEKIAKEQGYNNTTTTKQSEEKKKSKKRSLPEEEEEKESGDVTDNNANKDSPSEPSNNKKKRRKLTTPYSERRLNGGIKIKDIIIGDGNLVKTGKAVQILYKGYLEEDGKVFDKKQNKKDPLIFRLGT
eukprot:CAMPEP_0178980810 /NCGR_PEP_ID=MMETSP0789-20121207/26706_1 /TAXON_ID=3005 /ORGANISM="Rhizosolenia setigera, Strain CCMP 1694" /LENGTH=273 /DNA_ID=CAMNT_0020671271 /DNA_START=230 /DNA_END=1047 /DNA_ORIENTATION=-